MGRVGRGTSGKDITDGLFIYFWVMMYKGYVIWDLMISNEKEFRNFFLCIFIFFSFFFLFSIFFDK